MLTLRLGGHFLPLSTIAWGLSIAMLFGNVDALGRHTGLSNIPALRLGPWSLADPRAIYYLIWALVGLACWFAHNLLQSRPGRAIRSLRGGATLLGSVGADAYRVRLTLFVIAALLAGIAGWLYAHKNRFVSPSPFDVRASIEYLLMAVAGGLGQLAGALVGAALVLLLKNGLQDVLPMLSQRATQLEAVAFAILFIVLLHFARGGLAGFVVRWRARPRSRQRRHGRGRRRIATAAAAARARCRRRGERASCRCSDATKRFGGLVAVNDVSFDVDAGEIVGLIGPNGAGKTTMFNLLTCTLPMTAGGATFLGHDIDRRAAARGRALGLARTFQHVKLRPQMSLLDNVALGAHARTRAGVLPAGLRLDRARGARDPRRGARQLERIGLAAAPTSSPAACRSAPSASSRSRARSPPTRSCWCSTSRPPACAGGEAGARRRCCGAARRRRDDPDRRARHGLRDEPGRPPRGDGLRPKLAEGAPAAVRPTRACRRLTWAACVGSAHAATRLPVD